MSQEEIERATRIAKTVEGRSFKGVSQLDVDLVQAGYSQAIKDVGGWLKENLIWDIVPTAAVLCFHKIKTVKQSDAMLEALKQGTLPDRSK